VAGLAGRRGGGAALAARPAPPLGVGLLVGPDFDLMLTTLIRNLAEGRVAVVQALFTR
jgi:hypothetical protein